MSILKGDRKDIIKNSTWKYIRSSISDFDSVFIVTSFDEYSVIFRRVNGGNSIKYSIDDFLRDFIPEDTLYERVTSTLKILLVRFKVSGTPVQKLHELLLKLEI